MKKIIFAIIIFIGLATPLYAGTNNLKSIDLEFGQTEALTITDASQTSLDLSEDFTIELWLNLESTGIEQHLISKYNSVGSQRGYLMTMQGDDLRIIISDDGTLDDTHGVVFDTDAAVGTTTAHYLHAAITWDMSTETAIFYVNGVSVASSKVIGTTIGANIHDSTADFFIGASGTGSSNNFDGFIDEVRIFNVVRTSTEIGDNFDKCLVGDEAGLISYWRLEDNPIDRNANNNDLTELNTPVYSSTVPHDDASCAGINHSETFTTTDDGTTSLDIGNVVSSGTNRVLVVKIAYRDSAGGEVTGVDWDSGGTPVALTQLGSEARNGNANSQIWYLANPSDKTATTTITTTNSVRIVAAASIYTGVDQTNPFRTAANATNNGNDGSPTVNVVALFGEVVVDSLAQVSAGPDTATGDHPERHDAAAVGGGDDTRGASQEKISTGATETMGWTMSASDSWGIIAGALQEPQPVPVGVTPLPIPEIIWFD